MNLLTLARRANLGYSLQTRFKEARTRLQSGKAYSKSVRTSAKLTPVQVDFHEFTYLTGLVSLAEALLADIGSDFLSRFPGHLKDKTIPFNTLSEVGSVGAVIDSLVAKTINDWSYDRFTTFANQIVKLYDKKSSLDSQLLEHMAEIKATRDLYIHASGRINRIYLNKAGAKSREDQIGEKLELGSAYLSHVENTIAKFIDELGGCIPEKLKRMGKASAFREMWNATALSNCVPFETGWKIVNDNMVRPNEKVFAWAWSGSEKMLLDFFLGIYGGDKCPGREHDLMSALSRWPPATDEGQVISSWFDAPFWF